MARELRKLGTTEVAASGAKRSGMATIGLFLTAVILALSAGALTGVLASYYLNNSRYSVEVSALAIFRETEFT